MQKTVAVIGGSGFLGRAIIELLARDGMRVIALCRNAERAKYLKPMGRVGQISVVAGNALDDETLESVIAPADAVVNLVGILAETGKQKFSALQAELPGRIGALAAKHKLDAVVHLSAIGADAGSNSHYARSKGEGEANLLAAFGDAVILRPSIIFGPRDNFFNRFAGMAVLAPALPLPGGGRMLMQPVYVGDVAEAVVAGLALRPTKKKFDDRVFELGGPDVLSFRRLMEMTLANIKRKRALVPVPLSVMSFGAVFAGLLPNPPVTVDQVRLLAMDNVVSQDAAGLSDLGIVATPVETILPSYLGRFRPGGQFSR
ncbi:complex I NDUFA9 subunit family protein [Alphaproteobacteria bacterium]|nr:complex I NDUFA9 subunit family protein [Alphaproteobacteria bacterium]